MDIEHRFKSDPARITLGQRAFLQNCATCHGQAGRVVGPNLSTGNFRPRNLADQQRMAAVSDARLRRLIREGGGPLGVSGSMPSFSLTDAELDALVAFVRTLVVPISKEDS